MSRRSHLHNLVLNLRRYLAWQKAQGGVGIVPATPEERASFEARKEAAQDRRLAQMREKITAGVEEKKVEPPRPRFDPSPQAEAEPPPSRESAKPPKAEPLRVTSDTPLWKKHRAIHQWDQSRNTDKPAAKKTEPRQAAAGDVPSTPEEKMAFLKDYLGDCKRCPLHAGRTNLVFGDGDPRTPLLFIGEGPGFNEDEQGLPFVGKSGQLLTKMIEAMGFSREEVYITNVVKCRPPDNRDPAPEEVQKCSPFLKKQIQVIEPEVIVTLGRFATNALLETDQALGGLRGRWQDYQGCAVMPTYHPAYLLRNPEMKAKTWADLQMVMKKIGIKQRE